MIKFLKTLFKGRKQQCNIPIVSHSTSKIKGVSYKEDKAWKDPYCQICETATGKVLKDYGVTVHRT